MVANGNQKALTVSVAAYNVEGFLAETLESCLVPNADKLEVIVVNDGSTDGTLEVARRFERDYPGTFRIIDKQNGGYGSTINASLAVATGSYFRLLDGDDWFDSGNLAAYLELLDDCEEDAVFAPYVRVYEDGSLDEIRTDCRLAPGSYGIDELASQKNMAMHSLIYRTGLLRGVGFQADEHCFYTDVEYACLPFAGVRTVKVCESPLYRYRIGREGQSVSAAGIERHWEDIVRVCARLLSEVGDSAFGISEYLGMALSRECLAAYTFLTRIPATTERKRALISFDERMKSCPMVYKMTGRISGRVRLLRATCFLAYGPLCRHFAGGGR